MASFKIPHEIQRYAATAEQYGWRLEMTRGHHIRWIPPDPQARIVVSSYTPNNQRWKNNLRSDLRHSGLDV